MQRKADVVHIHSIHYVRTECGTKPYSRNQLREYVTQ